MIVDDLDIRCFAIIVPAETESPLIVDPNAVLTLSVALHHTI
jgi:hypothetical protein